MDLRNWEHNATSGTPVSGATVEARVASLSSPNASAVIASTTTNPDGMWELTGLPDAAVDIKVLYNGNIWWHKGLTKHNVESIYYNTPTERLDNFLRNAGFEGGPAGPWTVTNVAQAVFGSWMAINGAGSSAAVSRETASVISPSSAIAAKIVQTKVAGSLELYQDFPVPASMRGREVTLSVQVYQGTASAVRPFIRDSSATTYGSTSTTTGGYITMTVTATIAAAASFVRFGISVDISATVYADNAIAALGAIAPTYRPEYFSAYSLTNDMLGTDAVDSRVLGDNAVDTNALADNAVTAAKIAADAVGNSELAPDAVNTAELVNLAVTSAKLASGAALANLGFTPINKAGDTAVGTLFFGSTKTLNLANENGTKIDLTSGATYVIAIASNTLKLVTARYVEFWNVAAGGASFIYDTNSHVLTINGQTVYHTGNLSAAVALLTALNASQLGGVAATNYLRTDTHDTISPGLTYAIGGGTDTLTFGGNITITGNLATMGGKSRISMGKDGQERLFHALESPEPYFEMFGHAEGQGNVRVDLPIEFVNHVDTSDYIITLTPYGRNAVSVLVRKDNYFIVTGLGRESGDISFDWRVTARQIDGVDF